MTRLEGIVMSLQLFSLPNAESSRQMQLLVAYGSGAVILWGGNDPPTEAPLHDMTWTALWKTKVHTEAGMSATLMRLAT